MATSRKNGAATAPKKLNDIGTLVDNVALLQEERDVVKAALAEKESAIATAVAILEGAMQAAGLKNATGALGGAETKVQRVYNVTDWDAVYGYVLKKKNFELLQKRISTTAISERFEAGEQVPGVEPFDRYYLVVKPAKAPKPTTRAVRS